MNRYRVSPRSPEAHLFEVVLEVEEPDPAGQAFALPAWIPGSYMIRDFARNIISLDAWCREGALAVEKLDKDTWRCAPCRGGLRLRYLVYAWDLSVRGAHLDQTHAYFNGTSLFLRVKGSEYGQSVIELRRPGGERYAEWRVATTLPPRELDACGFGLYQAADYAELIDHPVEMGTFELSRFEVAGVPHEIAVTGRHDGDLERLGRDLARVCEQHVSLFGGLPTMARYLFQLTVVGDGYGGLEHRSSTSLISDRLDLPAPGTRGVDEGYRRLLGLCSHEYFHLWNVKRIRPHRFRDADLSGEVYTRLLWAFEGITSYYDDLALVRCGLISEAQYLELLARTITRVNRGSGRNKQTLEESSFDAWTRFYKQDENAPNAIVSYYAKGALVALALDLTIRRETGGTMSLDDVMVRLWEEYGKPDRGVGEHEIEALACRVTGLELKPFFDRALRSVEPLPLEELLASAGVGCHYRQATGETDEGGLRKQGEESVAPATDLGVRTASEGDLVRLQQVFDGGAAQAAGLAAGDQLVAVDGIRLRAGLLQKVLARRQPGSLLRLHAFRGDILMVFEVRLQPPPASVCELWLLDEADETAASTRRAWLRQG
ncbi:MAG TPA: M61 family peptidase [Sedimenticola sp.]|nr:M61 family peptidase [Sedimenticola sp.]